MWEFHNGIDISAKEGTKALAVADGKVAEVRVSETLGNVIEYDTDNGYRIIYAHLEKVLKKEGDAVSRGEAVALTGNSGLSTGPHLHYGIQKDGKYIDPFDFVELEFTSEVVNEYEARGDSPY